MKKNMDDWPRKILLHLFVNYSAFDVYINNFLENELAIGKANGNFGRKIVRILDELKEKKLITWNPTDHNNKEVDLNPDFNDNTSVTLGKYRFHTRLTLEGLDYIGNFVRIERQERFSFWSLVSSGLATVFIVITTIKACNDRTDQEVRKLNDRLEESIQRLDSIRKTHQEINKTLNDMVRSNELKKTKSVDAKSEK